LTPQQFMFVICSFDSIGAAIVFAFDTFVRTLPSCDLGEQAEANANAVGQFVMSELVTKQDLALPIDSATLKLTARLGAMLAAGVAMLGAIVKLT
jgi:hypothetical protein